ncbi:MAG TPA: YraN family protein [Gaiellaceae bacterium]|nr:YraN family protein [Gaiellaceae bacterium]
MRPSCASAGRPPCTACRSRRSAIANAAERRAARWYRLRGWRILGANVRAGRNEIDLVARRGRQLRFVEVKEKGGTGWGDPAEMVTDEKQRRVRRAASAWLASHPELRGLDIAFDVVTVWEGRLRRIPDAF